MCIGQCQADGLRGHHVVSGARAGLGERHHAHAGHDHRVLERRYDSTRHGRNLLYVLAAGATLASCWPLRASAAATKPLAFISSTNARRDCAARSVPEGAS